MIEWFAKNPVASNLLMFGILIAGLTSASRSVPVETFPSFEFDTVTVSTSFRGATPKTVEDGITLRIEEAIADVEGIEELTSRSSEGTSTVIAEVNEAYDKRNVLDDIKVRVDALNTLPSDAEKPVVSLNARVRTVIWVAVQGHVDTRYFALLQASFEKACSQRMKSAM